MTKQEKISHIKTIINDYGGFEISEVEGANSISVSSIGNLVALAEKFSNEEVTVNVYNANSFNCDSIETYTLEYDQLSDEVLDDIILLIDDYEAETIRTIKRISN